jgi:hypothetical protein
MKGKLAALVVAVVVLAAAPAFAGGISINFNSPSGVLGTSQAYGSITAYGFSCSVATSGTTGPSGCTATNLFGKNGSGDESGLGTAGDVNNEIGITNLVQLDLSSLEKLGVTSVTIGLNSIQSGEGFDVFLSNTLGTAGSFYTSGGSADDNAVPITVNLGGNQFLGVSANSANVLLTSLGATSSTPEPGTLVLMGSGLLLLGFGARRFA